MVSLEWHGYVRHFGVYAAPLARKPSGDARLIVGLIEGGELKFPPVPRGDDFRLRAGAVLLCWVQRT